MLQYACFNIKIVIKYLCFRKDKHIKGVSKTMPNIKSAKKRVLVIEKKSKQNKMIRSSVKTEIKKIDALLKEGKVAEAKAQLSEAFKMIDSAASKGVLHRNNASNKKSKLSIRVAAAEKAVSAKAE